MANIRLGELGLRQEQLAERTGLSEWSINRFLNGHHWPQVRNRVKISVQLWDDPMRLDQLAKGEVASSDLAAENAALRKLLERAGDLREKGAALDEDGRRGRREDVTD